MPRIVTGGNQPLGDAGVVALTRCGHWWVYPVRGTAEQMHRLASFNVGIACSFCLRDWRAATHPVAYGVGSRVN
jgi:hypothetical protein